MKCFVLFKLKPGLTQEEYEDWFRRVNVPAVEKMSSIKSYRVWRLTEAMDGEPTFEVLEEMELDDKAAFERELEEVPEMASMVEEWYSRVADQVVVFTEEITKE